MLESIVITGANRGLGLEFVKHMLLSQPAPKHLFAACRDPSKADELQKLAEQHACLKIITMDVTQDSDIDAAFKEVSSYLDEEEGINLLINNSGVFDQTGCSLRDGVTREQMQSHFDVNATAPVLITQKFLPLLKKAAEQNSSQPMSHHRAAVINLSTIMSSIQSSLAKSRGNSYHYRASKAALNMLTGLMSVELKDTGILVAAIHPGWTQTDMGGASADFDTETSVRKVWSAIQGMTERSSGLLHNYDGTVLPW